MARVNFILERQKTMDVNSEGGGFCNSKGDTGGVCEIVRAQNHGPGRQDKPVAHIYSYVAWESTSCHPRFIMLRAWEANIRTSVLDSELFHCVRVVKLGSRGAGQTCGQTLGDSQSHIVGRQATSPNSTRFLNLQS
jgi:hypothetical protein